MTRVNIGVRPSELCDQHLIAEYRELPRVFKYTGRIIQGPFRLGKGHVLWCSQFPGTLAARHLALVDEMHYRGFKVRHPTPPVQHGDVAPPAAVQAARPIVQARITERLADMSREPRWTRRTRPAWATRVRQDVPTGR